MHITPVRDRRGVPRCASTHPGPDTSSGFPWETVLPLSPGVRFPEALAISQQLGPFRGTNTGDAE